MSKVSKLKKSRRRWKQKSMDRAKNERYLRKELKRVKSERDRYKNEINQLTQRAHAAPLGLPTVQKVDVIHLALQLFVMVRISFRATSRVLKVLAPHLGIEKAPSHQTVINWVQRLTLVRMHQAHELKLTDGPKGSFCNGFIWMIDTSIGIGNGKILAVLALDAHHYQTSDKAPTFQEVSCVAAGVSSSWTGEHIAQFMAKVIGVMGRPTAILKDGGLDLEKGVSLLAERNLPCPTIDDVSHKVANLFKHEYKNDPMFDVFISACGQASKNLKQTLLACLAPPKVSVKARFMNLHKLVIWAEKLLKHSPPGKAAYGSMLEKLRASMDRMPECKSFIQRFVRDARPLLECQKIIKQKGLNHDTYQQCIKLTATIPPTSNIRTGFIEWADKQLSVAATLKLDSVGLPVTTDSLESLFGLAKSHGAGDVKDAGRIAIRLPALCGTPTQEEAQAVSKVSVAEQKELTESLPSVTAQRRQVLPNPGQLETLALTPEENYFELIPAQSSGPKSGPKHDLSNCNIIEIQSIQGSKQKHEVVSNKEDRIPKTGT